MVPAGLDLPERHGFANVVSKLPFTSKDLDPTSLLERKQGLEKYIQVWLKHCIHLSKHRMCVFTCQNTESSNCVFW